MKRLGLLLVALFIGLGWTAPARAYYIKLSDGTAGTLPASSIQPNDFISRGLFADPSISGFFGAQILLQASDGAVPNGLKVEFFGAEAGWHNEFNLGGSELFDHPGGRIMAAGLGTPLATYTTSSVAIGALPFSFDVNGGAASVSNGGGGSGPNFFASCVGTNPRYCDAVYLFLDDGGAGPDRDFDDLLVRITVTGAVPEPSTLLLLALALLGAGLTRRHRN